MIIHRDIKPSNVFLRQKYAKHKDFPEIVLGDFGCATVTNETECFTTRRYQPPEMPLCTTRSDVWGVGAVIHALVHDNGPYKPVPEDWSHEENNWWALRESKQPRKMPTRYSGTLNDRMMDALEMERKKRISSRKLVSQLENSLEESSKRVLLVDR